MSNHGSACACNCLVRPFDKRCQARSTWHVLLSELFLYAGMSSVQTLLLFGTNNALEDFLSKTSGNGSLVLGQDVKIAAVSDLGWGALENGGGSLDGLHPTTESLGSISLDMADFSYAITRFLPVTIMSSSGKIPSIER